MGETSLLPQHGPTEAVKLLQQVFPAAVLDVPNKGDECLSRLARDLGATKIVKRPLGISGMLIPTGDGSIIAINSGDQVAHKMYSLAHEIGHLVIAKTNGNAGVTGPKSRDFSAHHGHDDKKEERLCEEIAAELLMPTRAFCDRVQELGRSLANVPQLAGIFGTSITATALRYWELLSEPSLIVRWRSDRVRQGALVPAWQNRNKVNGPSVWVVAPKGWRNGLKFVGAESAYRGGGLKTSYEAILTRMRSGTRRYVNFPRYRMESMGFGRPENRFVLSVVYLNKVQG